MYSVLLYYKFTRIANPEKEVALHQEVCSALDLKGRILMNEEGVNGTVAGTKESIDLYKSYMQKKRIFQDIAFKESTSEFLPFPKLQIKYRDEIITTGAKECLNICHRARHVNRDTFHQWLVNGEDMVLLDMRNDYEWEIGRFVNSVRPPMKYFRELKEHMDFYEQFRGKKIVMFCTGGIRCEPASSYFLSKGFDQKLLYQLEGGIVTYGEKYGNEGYYEGKCFVFDDRMALPVNTSETATIVGTCLHCQTTTDVYRNCANKFCNRLFLGCEACVNDFSHTCSAACKEVILNPENIRPFSLPMMHRNKV